MFYFPKCGVTLNIKNIKKIYALRFNFATLRCYTRYETAGLWLADNNKKIPRVLKIHPGGAGATFCTVSRLWDDSGQLWDASSKHSAKKRSQSTE